MRSTSAALVTMLLVAGCGDDPIAVRHDEGDADYGRAALMTATAKFVASGRTVAAYGVLASEVAALRPQMDETVAQQTELQLVTLAVVPVESVRTQSPSAQTDALAVTVWPIALAPPIDVLAADGWRDPREAPIAVQPGEDASTYVRRMCGGPYASVCKYVVPEWQGAVLGTEAITLMTQRVRTAVANCPECTDPAWHQAVAHWEALDHQAAVDRERYEDDGDTKRWPVAGAGAAAFPVDQITVDVDDDGVWTIGGSRVSPDDRVAVLGSAHPARIGVHLRPGEHVATLDEVIADAAAAGATQLCVAARGDDYPWELRAYCLPAGTAKKPARPGRPGDSVQVLLRSLDVDAAGVPSLGHDAGAGGGSGAGPRAAGAKGSDAADAVQRTGSSKGS